MIIERPGLLTRYDNLRRKTFERLSKTVDTLGKVDGLPASQLEQARDALFHADHPYLIVLMGPFNTGKSSLINALLGASVLTVGATPTTDKISILRHGQTPQTMSGGEISTVFHPAPLLERVSLVDTPGLDSVFKGHDQITRRFLHRADLVLLVMLSTQAMSASNAEYLASLRDYGKRVIVVINQIDLITPEEQKAVQGFVTEQARAALGLTPQVWMVSARRAAEAQKVSPRDAALWAESGFEQIESLINRALSDVERARQKLETPLQIARNVMSAANEQVRVQQDALAEYRRSAQNVRGQIDAAVREQEGTVRETVTTIESAFQESAARGKEAIRDYFQWSRAAGLMFGGLGQVIGLRRLFRRRSAPQTSTLVTAARDRVLEPLSGVMAVVDRLPSRLEGRDVKDTDDLVLYARREIERLPGSLQGKVIGGLSAPTTYDRDLWKRARDPLAAVLEKARVTEFETLNKAVRNTTTTLAVYLISVLLFTVVLLFALSATNQGGASGLVALVALVLMIGGLAALPLRGAWLAAAHGRRIDAIKAEYLDTLHKAAADQIAFGKQMRQDAVAPFIRMVEAQLSQSDQLKSELSAHTTALTEIEREIGSLK